MFGSGWLEAGILVVFISMLAQYQTVSARRKTISFYLHMRLGSLKCTKGLRPRLYTPQILKMDCCQQGAYYLGQNDAVRGRRDWKGQRSEAHRQWPLEDDWHIRTTTGPRGPILNCPLRVGLGLEPVFHFQSQLCVFTFLVQLPIRDGWFSLIIIATLPASPSVPMEFLKRRPIHYTSLGREVDCRRSSYISRIAHYTRKYCLVEFYCQHQLLRTISEWQSVLGP